MCPRSGQPAPCITWNCGVIGAGGGGRAVVCWGGVGSGAVVSMCGWGGGGGCVCVCVCVCVSGVGVCVCVCVCVANSVSVGEWVGVACEYVCGWGWGVLGWRLCKRVGGWGQEVGEGGNQRLMLALQHCNKTMTRCRPSSKSHRANVTQLKKNKKKTEKNKNEQKLSLRKNAPRAVGELTSRRLGEPNDRYPYEHVRKPGLTVLR